MREDRSKGPSRGGLAGRGHSKGTDRKEANPNGLIRVCRSDGTEATGPSRWGRTESAESRGSIREGYSKAAERKEVDPMGLI